MTTVESLQNLASSVKGRLWLRPATRGELRKLSRAERVSALCRAVAPGSPEPCAGGSCEGGLLPRRSLGVGGFTLIELMIVIGIIGVLLVLIAPAFTSIKSGTDVTSAAYTIKGALDTARTYAKANNTFAWVGFFEEDVSRGSTSPATGGTGRIVISIVASKDGTRIYNPNNLGQQDITTGLIQVGTLTKIDNAHLWTHTDTPLTPTGTTFDYRPNVATTYCIGDASPLNSTTPFQYPVGNPAPGAQYTFVKVVQFNPRGEARINNSTVNTNSTEVFPIQAAAEIAVEPTHGATVPGSTPANVVAIQFAGFGGNVSIYRR